MNSAVVWILSASAAIIPTTLYVLVLWWLDRYEKEPRGLLLLAFFWGALPATLLSLLAEHYLGRPLSALGPAVAELMTGALLAPIVEEGTKCLALCLLLLFLRTEFDDVLDGIVYGATVGFGFAMTENALYFARSFQTGGIEAFRASILLRGVVFGMNHALFTSVFGAALGYVRTYKEGRRRWSMPVLGLLGAITLHSVHNLFAALSGVLCFSLVISLISDWGGVLVILVVMLLAGRQEKRWIAKHLQAEVASGFLTQAEYDMLGSYRRRLVAQWKARRQQGPAEARRLRRLAQLATELAFKLEQGDQARVQSLRGEIATSRTGSEP